MLLCGPLLHLLFVPVLYFATRGLMSSGWFLLSVLLVLFQPALGSVFRIGFIDYHGLLALLQLLVIAILVRRTLGPSAPHTYAMAVGAAAGLGVWITVEGLVLLAMPAALALMALWVREGGDWLDELGDFSLAFGLAVAFALMVERPPGDWLSIEYDRISILHLSMALVAVLVLRLLQRFPSNVSAASSWLRLRNAWIGAIAAAGTMLLFFPGLAAHPQQELGPIVEMVLETQTAETPYLDIYRPGQRLTSILRDLGPLLLVLPYMVFVALRGTHEQKRRFVVYLSFLVLMLAYLMLRTRALAFVQVCFVLPWLEALSALYGRITQWLGSPAGVRRAVASLALLPLVFAHAMPHKARTGVFTAPPTASRASCNDERIFALLRERRANSPGGTILAPIWNGPALVYRAGYDVISSPYHRNLRGIEDGFALLWLDPDEVPLRALAEQRRVEYVFVCRSYLHQRSNLIEESPEALVSRLAADQAPAWLRKEPLPRELEEKFLLYQTDFGR